MRPEKPKDRRPLLERPDLKPEEKVRIGRVVVGLLGWGLVATTALSVLAIWHLIRRGRLLRANQPSPKIVTLPEIEENP